MKVLLLAYGNPWRQDDGAGLAVLNALNRRLGLSEFSAEGQVLDEEQGTVYTADGLEIESRFVYQLDPGLAEAAAVVDRLILVDAHRDEEGEPIRRVAVEPGYEASFTFHHVSPASLLGVAQAAYGRAPQAWLYSVQGWQFHHGTQLSAETSQNVLVLAERILAELTDPRTRPES
jgi:hydrogenase maturation protease